MTEEHENQLSQFNQYLNETIGAIAAKYFVRVIWVVVVLAFGAGGWATKLQVDIFAISKAQTDAKVAQEEAKQELKTDFKEVRQSIEAANTATVARVVDWSKWRVMVDARDDNYERRLAWLETVERNRKP